MIDETIKAEILKNISISGSVDEKVKLIINGNINHVLNFGSGAVRLQTNVVRKFSLILSQPAILSTFNPFEIRCALCKRVISYPAWYYEVKYAVNHFHYFICFDKDSPSKPSTSCYRRG